MTINEHVKLWLGTVGASVVSRLLTLDLSPGTLSGTGAVALPAGQPLTHLGRLDHGESHRYVAVGE